VVVVPVAGLEGGVVEEGEKGRAMRDGASVGLHKACKELGRWSCTSNVPFFLQLAIMIP
jgi:hypothetical protein